MPVDPTIEVHTRAIVRGLDPRLAVLHWLGEARVKVLRAVEREQLERIEARLNAPFPSGLDEQALAARSSQRAREVRALLFSPLTTGILPPPAPDYARATGSDATETILSVLILADLSAQDLRALGCVPRSQVRDVFTAWVPWSRLPALVGAAGVRCVELARALKPSLGTAIPATGIKALHDAGHDGAGVIVGIVDNVLDFHHPAFRNGTNSRVLFLWDQELSAAAGESAPPATASGPGGDVELTGLGYGVEYPQATITQQVAAFAADSTSAPYDVVRHKPPTNADEFNAHGTYVSGIAAGNDGGLIPSRPGAAPASDLIFVRFKSESPALALAESTHVVHAFDYIFKRAEALDQACVVNFSYNDAQGAHDGSSLLERTLDDHLGLLPGRAITVSAGNDNQWDWHAVGELRANGPSYESELSFQILSGSKIPEEAQIWFNGSAPFDFALDFAPSGGTRKTWKDWTPAPLMLQLISTSKDTDIFATFVEADPRNGDSMVSILLLPRPPKALATGTYYLRLRSGVALKYHAWISATNVGTKWTTSVQHDELTVGLPATGDRVISVAEHDNVTAGRALLSEGGCGPARDGDKQPFITAPSVLYAPKPTSREQFSVASLFYLTFYGTSAAAPLVAGTCALMFECLGATADWSVIREALRDNAGPTPPNAWDKGWGYGFLQAHTLCDQAPQARVLAIEWTPDERILPRQFPKGVPRPKLEMQWHESERGTFTSEITLVGSESGDALEIRARRGMSIEIELPFLSLPWRSSDVIKKLRDAGETRPMYRDATTRDPIASLVGEPDPKHAPGRMDVQGVERAVVNGGNVRFQSAAGARILIQNLRIASGAKVTMRVWIRGAEEVAQGYIGRVVQLSEGRWKKLILLTPGVRP